MVTRKHLSYHDDSRLRVSPIQTIRNKGNKNVKMLEPPAEMGWRKAIDRTESLLAGDKRSPQPNLDLV